MPAFNPQAYMQAATPAITRAFGARGELKRRKRPAQEAQSSHQSRLSSQSMRNGFLGRLLGGDPKINLTAGF